MAWSKRRAASIEQPRLSTQPTDATTFTRGWILRSLEQAAPSMTGIVMSVDLLRRFPCLLLYSASASAHHSPSRPDSKRFQHFPGDLQKRGFVLHQQDVFTAPHLYGGQSHPDKACVLRARAGRYTLNTVPRPTSLVSSMNP